MQGTTLGFHNITISASFAPSQSCHVFKWNSHLNIVWPWCKERPCQSFIATRSPRPGYLCYPHPNCIDDLHASKDHPGEQLIIDAWHCVGDGEELARGLRVQGVFLNSFCNSSRVSNWKWSVLYFCGVHVFMTLHSLLFLAAANEGDRWQQEQEESLLPHLLQKRKHCKSEYIANAIKDIFLYFLVRNWGWLKCSSDDSHLYSRNHQLCSLFAVGAPETMSRVKCIETYN